MGYRPQNFKTPVCDIGDSSCRDIGGFKIVEFEFRVRVRVSSKFSNFEGMKNVELFN